jgi:hypothetical protein
VWVCGCLGVGVCGGVGGCVCVWIWCVLERRGMDGVRVIYHEGICPNHTT